MFANIKSRLCLSIFADQLDSFEQLPEGIELVEYRLDNYNNIKDIANLFKNNKRSIATLKNLKLSDDDKYLIYKNIIECKPTYLDVDYSEPYFINIIDLARNRDVNIILSSHSPKPENVTLNMIDEMKTYNPDLIKIVPDFFKNIEIDNFMNIYELVDSPDKLLAFCSGDAGKSSRLQALKSASPFMYVSLNGFTATADGQYEYYDALRILENQNEIR